VLGRLTTRRAQVVGYSSPVVAESAGWWRLCTRRPIPARAAHQAVVEDMVVEALRHRGGHISSNWLQTTSGLHRS
jgi:hypothetical protein